MQEQITIQIKDLTAPTIKLKTDRVEIKVNSKFDVNNYIESVFDNYDKKINFKTKGKVDIAKPGTYVITISAVDKSGNASNKKLTVLVTPEKVDSNHSSVQEETKTNDSHSDKNTPPTSHPLKGKKYLFSQGYDNITASQACANDLLSLPGEGVCIGLYDEYNEPIGMQLR